MAAKKTRKTTRKTQVRQAQSAAAAPESSQHPDQSREVVASLFDKIVFTPSPRRTDGPPFELEALPPAVAC